MIRHFRIDPMLSMINVVFLLIAFFLFGRLVPSTPISVELPHAVTGSESRFDTHLLVDSDGAIFEIRNEALVDYDANTTLGDSVLITVDATTSANHLAHALTTLPANAHELKIEVRE